MEKKNCSMSIPHWGAFSFSFSLCFSPASACTLWQIKKYKRHQRKPNDPVATHAASLICSFPLPARLREAFRCWGWGAGFPLGVASHLP